MCHYTNSWDINVPIQKALLVLKSIWLLIYYQKSQITSGLLQNRETPSTSGSKTTGPVTGHRGDQKRDTSLPSHIQSVMSDTVPLNLFSVTYCNTSNKQAPAYITCLFDISTSWESSWCNIVFPSNPSSHNVPSGKAVVMYPITILPSPDPRDQGKGIPKESRDTSRDCTCTERTVVQWIQYTLHVQSGTNFITRNS